MYIVLGIVAFVIMCIAILSVISSISGAPGGPSKGLKRVFVGSIMTACLAAISTIYCIVMFLVELLRG